MKFQTLLSLAALCAITIFSSCGSDSGAAKDTATETTAGAQPDAATPGLMLDPTATPAPAAPTAEPPQNAAGVWHYTCAKGCAGGAGAAVACAKCGGTLAHNTAYHGAGSPAANPAANPAGAGGQVPVTMPTPGSKQPEPPQNAAGVWHYTCPDGCAGGAGAASPCAKCGKTLAHNKAYH